MSLLYHFSQLDDKTKLFACTAGSVIVYNVIRSLRNFRKDRQKEWIPVGRVSELYIYPAKSCKGKKVFSLWMARDGSRKGEVRDRQFQMIRGEDGLFITARQKPQMILIDVDVVDGMLCVRSPEGKEVKVSIEQIKARRDIRTTMQRGERIDGLDCGDEVSQFLSEYLEERDVRLVMLKNGLFSDRIEESNQSWWNSPMPYRKVPKLFYDHGPTLIQSEASLDELNKRLEKKVTQLQLRPGIVISDCDAWDEDRWMDIRIGDVRMQRFRPSTRCVLITVDPADGKMDPGFQPLKTLREFRLAPDGPMRQVFKESPMFGLHATVETPGYLHIGQVVYSRFAAMDAVDASTPVVSQSAPVSSVFGGYGRKLKQGLKLLGRKLSETVSTLTDMSIVYTYPVSMVDFSSQSAYLILSCSVGSVLGSFVLGPLVDRFIWKSVSAAFALAVVPSAMLAYIRRHEKRTDTHASRFRMLALAFVQGIFSGHAIPDLHPFAQPLAFLTPLIVSLTYEDADLSWEQEERGKRFIATLVPAFVAQLAIGYLSGNLTVPFHLINLLYTAATAGVMQYVFRHIDAPYQRTYRYQLGLLFSFVLIKFFFAMFGSIQKASTQ